MAIGATAPVWLRVAEPVFAAGTTSANAARHLLVVFLRGGNDPLATVAPMGNADLLKLRPNVGLRDGDMLAMGNGWGITKQLPVLNTFWKAGQLAVIHQVGTAASDLSHSVATRRWETGSPEGRYNSGWLGRYLDMTTGSGAVRAAAFGDTAPTSLLSENSEALSLMSIAQFAFNDTAQADGAARHAALSQFASAPAPADSMLEAVVRGQQELLTAYGPITKIGNAKIDGRHPTAADNVAQIFAAGVGTEIGFLSVPSFDTHTDQYARHASVAATLNTTLSQFFSTAGELGVRDNSAVLLISEFGRRVPENSSGGTDHGEATSVYLLGAGVKGGMYGPTLDLSQLDDGNLPTRVDLRSVYASILDQWLRANPTQILGGTFPTIPLFR